jgi:hypothetical protein
MLLEDDPPRIEQEEPNRFEVLKQLDRITTSPHFKNSKRYPALLKFVVEYTLGGRIDALKERTLGIEVFGRPNNYDTNADPVVRVTAGEIRKRIAQYYQADGHEHEVRIDLPVGSYVPQFLLPAGNHGVMEVDGPSPSPKLETDDVVDETAEGGETLADLAVHSASQTYIRPRLFKLSAVGLFLFAIIAIGLSVSAFLWRTKAAEKGINFFWNPILATDGPVLIVIGVHSLDAAGKDLSPGLHVNPPDGSPQNMLSSMIRSEMVPVSDIVSYSKLTRLLTERGHTYRTQGSSETSFEQLQRGPVILIGGFDNFWTLRLTHDLRYRFETPGQLLGVIVDSQQPATSWQFDNGQSSVSNSRDYAIVASFFDPQIEQRVLIAAGIGKSGTVAATEFMTVDKYLESWRSSRNIAKNKNVEMVLSTEIVEGQPGPPKVIASYTW